MAQPRRSTKEDKARAVVAARTELEMTQQFLADVLGVHQVTVARWENGDRVPSERTLRRIYDLTLGGRSGACPMCGHDPEAARRSAEWGGY